MKTSINLLPADSRSALQRIMRLRALAMQGLFWVIIPVGVILVLWALMLATTIERNGLAVVDESMRTQYDVAAVTADEAIFRSTNIAVKRAAKAEVIARQPSRTITQIAQHFPQNSRLDRLTIVDSQVTLAGTARNRAAVLALKEQLEQNNCFADVVTPLASIVQKEDVSFTINFNIIKECL